MRRRRLPLDPSYTEIVIPLIANAMLREKNRALVQTFALGGYGRDADIHID